MMHSQNYLFFYYKSNVRLFKLINSFRPCPNPLAPSTPILLPLNFCYKNFLAKDFLRNFFALFFIIYDAFAKESSLFYYKLIVRLFKLSNYFSFIPNILAPSTPIDIPLFFQKIINRLLYIF